ncbi:Hypothetical protein ABNV54_02403 [Enterococcus faecalis]
MTPNGLPAYPPGYNASLSKTVVDSENFHYKAPKAFPEFFSSGNRHFQFKGWYKGPARPDPKAVKLETSLTPEFDVTYDGADNLYVFYDEVKEMTTTIPEVTYKFGFVDEKGALVAPTNTDNTMYYFLENRRVTEHYVNEAGAEVPMPTGFTQGNQTVIDSDTYHFKLAKELPFSYFLNNKAYRFKGWYKGKTKPKGLETSRTPEYDTTFDDNDDLTVVYEEIKYGGNAVTFGFVGEDGQLLLLRKSAGH